MPFSGLSDWESCQFFGMSSLLGGGDKRTDFFYLPNLALCVILKLKSIPPSLDGLGLLLASRFDGC